MSTGTKWAGSFAVRRFWRTAEAMLDAAGLTENPRRLTIGRRESPIDPLAETLTLHVESGRVRIRAEAPLTVYLEWPDGLIVAHSCANLLRALRLALA